MVCNRCVFVVEEQLRKSGMPYDSVMLGEIDFGDHQLEPNSINKLKQDIESFGFELLDDKNSQLIEKVKQEILNYTSNHLISEKKINLSAFLKQQIDFDYNYISNLFSSIAGFTIEYYVIQLKIEKVKEMLFYNELTLSEIADQLGYSSVAHLSKQFKKVTGMTPSHFKKLKDVSKRVSLDQL